MREFSILDGYPQPQARVVGPHMRTIKNKIIASYRDERYYDGDRNNGYGGYKYDGRWKSIVDVIMQEYGLDQNSSLLQMGCEKGFLLHDFHEKYPQMKLHGYEMSPYAIENAMPSIKDQILLGTFEKLPFADDTFDFVIAIGVIYTLTLRDCISCLKEIQRIGKGKSFITAGAYHDERGKRLFKDYWSVLGSTVLHVDEWLEVFKEANYTGDYAFTTAEKLNLVEEEKV
jgi:ubiquinone/menaquinone biosynthesis C-methylase UbiE